MFKKIFCLALAVVMIMSVAAVGFSAAQVEIADVAADADAAVTGADADVATTGAEADAASTGAVDKSKCLNYDNSKTNWAGPILFYIYEPGEGELKPWGSKNLAGVDNGDGTWSFDPSSLGLESGKQYGLIMNDKASNAQTYDLLFDLSCLGDTVYVTGNKIENPTDSNKTGDETRWTNNTNFGPALVVTSIGNVVGETCPSNTTPYKMMVDFLKNTLDNARTYSKKDDQTLLDDTGKGLKLTKDEVAKAVEEAGVKVEWTADKSSLSGGSSDSGNNDTTTTTTSNNNTTSTSTTKTGSASDTKTGQTENVLFIMLGVMVVAAGVIFFARKRDRA